MDLCRFFNFLEKSPNQNNTNGWDAQNRPGDGKVKIAPQRSDVCMCIFVFVLSLWVCALTLMGRFSLYPLSVSSLGSR